MDGRPRECGTHQKLQVRDGARIAVPAAVTRGKPARLGVEVIQQPVDAALEPLVAAQSERRPVQLVSAVRHLVEVPAREEAEGSRRGGISGTRGEQARLAQHLVVAAFIQTLGTPIGPRPDEREREAVMEWFFAGLPFLQSARALAETQNEGKLATCRRQDGILLGLVARELFTSLGANYRSVQAKRASHHRVGRLGGEVASSPQQDGEDRDQKVHRAPRRRRPLRWRRGFGAVLAAPLSGEKPRHVRLTGLILLRLHRFPAASTAQPRVR